MLPLVQNAPVDDEVRFETGDLVRLKNGGPPMIVRAVSGDSAYCQWYSEVHLHQGTFLFSSLRPAGNDQRTPPGPTLQAHPVAKPVAR